jgi:hypothetical protein
LREITRHLRRHATPLHQRELAEIDRRTIATLLGEIEAASGAVSRNRAVPLCQRFGLGMRLRPEMG